MRLQKDVIGWDVMKIKRVDEIIYNWNKVYHYLTKKELNSLVDLISKETEKELEKYKETLEFYADRSNWVTRSGRIGTSLIDIEDRESGSQEFPWAGGKLARKILMELRRDK